MKRILLICFLFTALSAVFAQRMPSVAITPFEAAGRVTADEADNITRRIIAELRSWGTLNIITGAASDGAASSGAVNSGADYIVRGTLSRQGNNFILTAETIDAKQGKVLNESREQAISLGNFPDFSLCAKIIDKIPLPNYLLGTWQAVINMPNGPVSCIIEFKSDRTIRVEKYDTWESKQHNALKYEGYGSGTYSYIGYAQRVVNQVRIDASANFYFKLEDTLPEQNNFNRTALYLVFNDAKNNFEIIGGSLPCGRNYDGPSVYPSENVGFTKFTKIR